MVEASVPAAAEIVMWVRLKKAFWSCCIKSHAYIQIIWECSTLTSLIQFISFYRMCFSLMILLHRTFILFELCLSPLSMGNNSYSLTFFSVNDCLFLETIFDPHTLQHDAISSWSLIVLDLPPSIETQELTVLPAWGSFLQKLFFFLLLGFCTCSRAMGFEWGWDSVWGRI